MVHWVATAIIDLVFIVLYAILLVLNVFNVFSHGFKKEAGYIFLVIVSLCTLHPLRPPLNFSEDYRGFVTCRY